ncbi:MAG: NUDIX domain-containing protein [Christensenellales bacterium]
MAKNYTICILFNKELTKTLLIKKIDGKLYGGRYNSLGGKVEPGESLKEACIREVWEESDNLISLADPKHIATLTFPYENPIHLHAFYDVIDQIELPDNREGTPQWVELKFLLDFNNEAVVGNGNLAYFCRLALSTEKNIMTAGKEAASM